ncbi:hypothetical protein ACIBM4_05225 [Streptomyces sp. NPDC050256]
MTENAHAGNTTHKAQDIALASEQERILYEGVKNIRLTARRTIGKAN